MITTIRNEILCEGLRLNGLQSYGTSEGARKAWDTRGRTGKKKTAKTPRKEASSTSNMRSELTRDMQKRKELISEYKSLNERIEGLTKKLHDHREVTGTASKVLHFFRALGEWIEPFKNLYELVATAGLAVWGVTHEMAVHSATVHSVVSWAMAHVAPVMNHITVASVQQGFGL